MFGCAVLLTLSVAHSYIYLSGNQFAVRLGDRMILLISHLLAVGPGMLSGSNTASKVEAKASIYMKLSFITLAKTSQIPKFAFLRLIK